MPNILSEEQLLLKALSRGDEAAFKSLFLKYFQRVRRFIDRLLQDGGAAEDMAQDIFLRIWQNRESMAEVANLNAYMYNASRNAVHQYLRHKLVVQRYNEENGHDAVGEVSDNNVENHLFAEELLTLITYTVDNMPLQRRTIYNLSRVDGHSNDEIADLLSISKRTVENHITAALSDIRKVLRNFFIF